MAITMNTAAAAQEAARKEAERQRRRAQIRAQIADVDKKIQEANNCINQLSKNNSVLAQTVGVWKQSIARYRSNTAASQVVIKNLFEGVVAEKLKDSFPIKVSNMVKRTDLVGGAQGGIGRQIAKIRDYIAKLEITRSNLQAQLNAI